MRAEFTDCLSEPGLTFDGLESIEEHLVAMAIEAGLFDEASTEEERIEAIVEVQTAERELAARLEDCGGLAEWERLYAELAEPLRRDFAADHLDLTVSSNAAIPLSISDAANGGEASPATARSSQS